MSLLNQLFNRGVFGAKCKTCLSLAISRIKLRQNHRDLQLKRMRKEIAEFLLAGQEAIARIRVEHVIREQNLQLAYDALRLFCEFVLARVPVLETQRECPGEVQAAVASLIFAAPRCSDVPDLLQVKNLFGTKYGKEFLIAGSELRPDSGVNRILIENLPVKIPSAEEKLGVLKDIAQEYNVRWDSSNTQAEFSKKHEDLLGGSKQMCDGTEVLQAPTKPISPKISTSNGVHPIVPASSKASESRQPPSPMGTKPRLGNNEAKLSPGNPNAPAATDVKNKSTSQQSSDVLEKARAAMASAQRAAAAARAAAELVNVQFGSLKVKGQSS
ncbi:hypothetical protein HS088_TW22G01445 [Tripterygium wilfordii]|uniref:IST1-like protein n=1 Tax=Tripterygium wilfordii TaxID=458696 RepID=A0A7J7C0X5_TRIWF|nr:IST1 homolog [Tripterygium wilfordii]KAF5727748.1 hypothetical protein HS088_TW22G01445 [Tripterygium wilfordii]